MGSAQHVSTFGHEVHATEHDVVGFGASGDLTRELEGIAGVVGELDHLVALIVVTQDHELAAERRARFGNAPHHLLVRESQILFRQRLALGEMFLLVLSQQRNDRRHRNPTRSVRGFVKLFAKSRREKGPHPIAGLSPNGIWTCAYYTAPRESIGNW